MNDDSEEIDLSKCPACQSDDYIELTPDELEAKGYEAVGPPVYRCEECGEEWS